MTSTTTLLNDILADPDPDGVGVRILDAALAEYLAHGFRRTSIDDIARRARLGRATIYRRFGTHDELVNAVLTRELRQLFTAVAAAGDGLPTVADQLVEGFVVGLRKALNQPLLHRMITMEPEAWLPFLTTSGGSTIAVLRQFLVQQYRITPEVAEIVVRLSLSLVLTPDSCLAFGTDEEARVTARRFLAPLVTSVR